jgi:hypothetical protein
MTTEKVNCARCGREDRLTETSVYSLITNVLYLRGSGICPRCADMIGKVPAFLDGQDKEWTEDERRRLARELTAYTLWVELASYCDSVYATMSDGMKDAIGSYREAMGDVLPLKESRLWLRMLQKVPPDSLRSQRAAEKWARLLWKRMSHETRRKIGHDIDVEMET